MPIRINLLAEAQAIEEQRRRDPVKRAIWLGAFLALAVLAWSSSLQLKTLIAKASCSRVEAQLAARTNEFQHVLENQKKLADANHKLTALNQLATGRLLYGTMLNALQQTTLDEVQLMRMRTEQTYTLAEAMRPRTNANKVTAGRAASVTEKIVLTLDARDNSSGDQVNRFKKAMGDAQYFQKVLGKTNEVRLTSLSPPQPGPDGKPFVLFTLECRYPEKSR